MTLTKQIQNLTVNEHLPLHKCLEVTAKADQEREETLALLKECVTQVGMVTGGKLEAKIAAMEGRYFSYKDYYFERFPGEQGI